MATSLEKLENEVQIKRLLDIGKRRSDWSSAIQYLRYGAKIVKIGPADPEILWLQANKSGIRNKIGCHGNVPWGIGKTGPDQENSHKYLPFGEKIVKICPVDTEIALLWVKKNKKNKEGEITEGKIYSPSGKFATLAKIEGRIDHLPFNTYHMVQRLWKSVERIWDTSAASKQVIHWVSLSDTYRSVFGKVLCI